MERGERTGAFNALMADMTPWINEGMSEERDADVRMRMEIVACAN